MAKKKKENKNQIMTTDAIVTVDKKGEVKQTKPTKNNAYRDEYNYRNNLNPTTERVQTGRNNFKDITSTVSRNVLRNTNKDGYLDTKKKYGDYNKNDLSKSNYKIYQKDNKYYYFDEKDKKYKDMKGYETTTHKIDSRDSGLLNINNKNEMLKQNKERKEFDPKFVQTTEQKDISKQITSDMASDDAEQEQKWLNSLSKEDRKAYEESAKYQNKIQKEKKKAAEKREIKKQQQLRFEKDKEAFQKFQNREQIPSLIEAGNYVKENKAKEEEYLKNNPVAIKGSNAAIRPQDVIPTLNNYKAGEIAVETQPERLETAKERNELARTQYEENLWAERNRETTGLEKVYQPIKNIVTDIGQGLDTATDFGNRLYIAEDGTQQYLPSRADLQWERVRNSYNTKIGKFAAETTNNVGKILGTQALNLLIPGSGTAVYWAQMYGNSYQKAFNQTGGDASKASANALINTGLEFLTGKFLGSATKGLTGGKTSELETALSNLSYKISKNPVLSSYLGKAGSEFSEEFIQEYLGNAVDILTLGSDGSHDNLKELLSDSDVLEAALYSGLMGAVSSVGIGGVQNLGTRASGGYTEAQSIQLVNDFKEELNNTIEEYKKNPKENKTKIKKLQKVLSELDKETSPFTDDTVQSNIDRAENINKSINSTYSDEQKAQIDEIEQMVNSGEIDAEEGTGYIRQVQNGTYAEHRNLERIAQQKMNEVQQAFRDGTISPDDYNQELKSITATLQSERNRIEGIEESNNINTTESLQETAIRNNLDPNSPTVQAVQNMMEKRGINATFDANRFDDVNTNAFWSIDENGKRQVVFNPNATTNDIVEEIAIHELTHDLMSSENSRTALKVDNLLDLVKTMKGYEEARSRLEQTYSDVYDINDPKYEQLINEEVIADVLGRKLGNQEFINQLVNKKPSIAKRIYDFVVDKLNSLVNNGKVRNERLYWENIKNNFEKAYNMEYENRTNKVKEKKSITSKEINNNSFSNKENVKVIDDKPIIINEEAYTSKPKDGTIRLYTNTKYKNVEAIMKEGLRTDIGRKHKEYEGNMLWFETTPNLKGYGGTTIAVDVPLNTSMEQVNDTQYTVFDNITPDNIVFIDRPVMHDMRTSEMSELLNRWGEKSLRDVFESALKSNDAYMTQNEFNSLIDNIKGETNDISNNKITQDNQGRTLTEQQVKYFKDSKLRDKNGNLKVFYHGASQKINIFDKNHKAKRYTNLGTEYEADIKGFFFTENKDYAKTFGDVNEYYINSVKPLNMDNKDDLNKIFKPMLDEMLKNEDIYQWQYDKAVEDGTIYRRFIDENGVDWETIDEEAFNESVEIMRDLGYDSLEVNEGDGETSIFVFDSNQIKDIDNQNPTSNEDTRLSQSNDEWKRFLDKNIKRSGTGRTLNDIRTGPNQLSQVETTGEQGAKYWQSQGTNEKVAKLLSSKDIKEQDTKTLIQKIKDGKATLGEEIQLFKRKFVDKGSFIRKLSKLKKNRLLDAKYDKMGTAQAEAQYDIGKAQTDLKGIEYKNFIDENNQKVSMSLEDIWKDVDEDLANEYLAHWLNVDRYGKVNESGRKLKENLGNQVKQGKITREEANEVWDNSGELYKYVFSPDITDKDSQQRINELEKAHPELVRFGKNIWQYGKNQLQNRVEAGTISKEEADRFANETPHYVRLQRNVPKSNKGPVEFDKKGNATVNKQIKEFQGSTLDILPFKNSMAEYTQKIIEEIRTNEFAKELAKTMGVSSTLGNVNSIDEMFGVDNELIKDNGDGTYELTFFNNGVATTIPINKAIYEAMQPNKHYSWEDKLLFKGIRKVDSWRRALLTDKNPVFLATNMVKDLFDAPLNSKYPVAFAKNYPRAIKEIATGGKYFKQYQALGGLQNTYFENEGFKKQGSKLNPLNWIGKANEIIEQLPRLAEFISTMEKTGDVNEAMFNAAEITTNFKRGGDYTKALNRNGATFLNASVQGFSKQIRNFTEINNPTQAVQMLAKIVVLGIGPALFNDFVYEDDDEYKELQDYQKDRYYLIKGENGNWIRIPKGRAVSIFQSAARRTKYFAQGDKKAFKGFGELTSSQIAPNNPFENNIISPFVNVATNKSWSGNPIVSKYMEERVKPQDQWDAKTDEFSKWIGKELKISPKKVNYIIDQYSGAIGDLVLPNITKYKTHEVNNPLDIIANPFRDKFTTNIANSSKSQNEFYDAITEATKSGTEKGALQLKYLNSRSKEISDLRKEMMDYQASDASAKDKIKKTREYLNKINKIAREATDSSKDIKINEYTATIGDKTYYKDSGGDWRKESEKTAKKRGWDNISAEDYYAQKQAENNASENKIENTIKALNFNNDDYEMYSYKIGQLKADKDANGKSISGSKKKKVIEYVNSLPISDVQKAALLKKQNYKVSGYDQKIANEINKSGLTQAEKNEIYSYLNLGR